jgi:3-oxoacyl-[acyl-carrier-protein] synthase II
MSIDTRIVVTGMGAVTPFGEGVSLFWDQLITGHSAIGETVEEYLRQWAPVTAQVKGFKPEKTLDKQLLRKTERFTQLALVAAHEALLDAGWEDLDALHETYAGDNIGVSIGCTFGGVQSLEAGSTRISKGVSNKVNPRLVPKSIPNAAAAAIAMQYGIHGPVLTYSTACASSSNSIGEAGDWLKLGKADMVVAGGTECLFSPALLSGLRSAGALAVSGPEDFSTWSRPFDQERKGMIMGEGAAILILETLDHALKRNAHIYAELIGYGTSNDAYHETSPDPNGVSAQLAMRKALESASIDASDIDYINAHATATMNGDKAESISLQSLFGDHLKNIPVSSIKGSVGHMLGAAGAIESIACIQSICTSKIPPTLHCDHKEDYAPTDIVPDYNRSQNVSIALSNSFGFGGQNSVLIWKKFD